jgi:hypothetical protein
MPSLLGTAYQRKILVLINFRMWIAVSVLINESVNQTGQRHRRSAGERALSGGLG